MKTIKFVLALCALTVSLFSQPYGVAKYPRTNSWLSSGTVTTQNPGFLMAGTELTTTNFNFSLDRVGPGGVPAGNAWNFQNGYTLSGGGSGCGASAVINNCVGVTAIESYNPSNLTTVSPNVVVGAVGYCCFFATLDNGGNVVNTTSYVFPGSTPNSVSKPLITPSLKNPNQYFIVGSFDGKMYMLRVDSVGAIQQNFTCDLPNSSSTFYVEPRAIIESPYGNKELTIVGWISNTPNGNDGFFYQIPGNFPAGGATVFKRYDITKNLTSFDNNEFTSIAVENNNGGFLIGGASVAGINSHQGNAWMLTLSSSGAVCGSCWSTVIDGTQDPTSGKILGVIERTSTSYGYHYFGACAANSGITVYKLDNLGNAFTASWPGTNDEIIYNNNSINATWPTNITYLDNGGNADIGLHIYGNRDNTGPGNHYFVEAYFNGVAGCEQLGNIAQVDNTSPTPNNVSDNPGAQVTNCSVFSIAVTNNAPYTALCGPSNSIGGGSNLKGAPLGVNKIANEKKVFSVYPNPVCDRTVIHYQPSKSATMEIEIYDNFGRQVFSKRGVDVEKNHDYKIELNLEDMKLTKGIYFLRMFGDGEILQEKIVYEGN
ncbi:MAG: T9SS type A sorting domain-containing protein [bacterium]|nr:T9SS type A sorting domain-containing protein [bacterium]